MKKTLTIATLLSTALLASPPVQAASYQDRAMTTGAVVGATTGAVVGSNSNQAVEGAIFGAVLGTIAGAIIADQYRPAPVVYTRTHRPVVKRHIHVQHRPVVKRHVHVQHRPVVKRHVYTQKRPAHRVAERRTYDRHVARRDSRQRTQVSRHDSRGSRPVNQRGHNRS
ncbi:MAG: glycine zipper domain-containing protein [Mariprofundaceae bacterium]|nr:glycine zipper domain-containing protein [Mariprofundaceae bacterium]